MSWNSETVRLEDLVVKRRRMVRELRAAVPGRELRIAVLCGTVANEIVEMLEVHLLAAGFNPIFHVSDYGRFYEDSALDPSALVTFQAELVYVHTSHKNVQVWPSIPSTEEQHHQTVQREVERFRQIWKSLHERMGCQVIQNNFEPPPFALFGNMDAVVSGGRTRFLLDLNAAFAAEARENLRLTIQDVHSIAGRVGLDRWFDWSRWFNYKVLHTPAASLAMARSLAAMIKAMYGRSRKVLALDLDNTLWGGVIGDDGVDGIQIGRETPTAEAYTEFQEYCSLLRQRGVLLAIASKNEAEIAEQGLTHPDTVLKRTDFAAFKANWEAKQENLQAIANELDLGIDSFVFVDDNPAERAIVEAQLPSVAVPDVGSDVAEFISVLDAGRYFESVALSLEDFQRAEAYLNRAEQSQLQSKYADYGEYLDSLEMVAEIDTFKPIYLERITQLTNKSNQFNLTTRRYTLAEMQSVAVDLSYITLYGRLRDRFGDNGLVSVIIGHRQNKALNIDLWLMSCRVLKRDMERAMLDALVERTRSAGMVEIVGCFIPTAKNKLVADHYEKLGFAPLGKRDDGGSDWVLRVNQYQRRNSHIVIESWEKREQ